MTLSRSDRRIEIDTYVQEGPALCFNGRDPGLIRVDWSIVGERRFFVQICTRRYDLLDWEGLAYETAILKAEELARKYRCHVVDKVAAAPDG